jgi:hypothetical protein
MVEQADVYVKNILSGDLAGDIRVMRMLPGGIVDMDFEIAPGDEEKLFLPNPEVSIIINLPIGLNTEMCHLNLGNNEDLLSWEKMTDRWTIQISVPNDIIPEVPTYVKVAVSGPF